MLALTVSREGSSSGAQLEPGAQIPDGENFDPTKVGYSSISFGGRFCRTARINLDGVGVSDETVGTTTEDIPVNVTTKSGTNAYHGEAFGFFRDSAVGAANLPSPTSPVTAQKIPTPWQRNLTSSTDRFKGFVKIIVGEPYGET